jgi:thiol-disulfide isomerase/thioredoxin
MDWAGDFFVIPFPADLKIYDYEAEKVVGGLERKPLVKVGQPAPPLAISRWVDGKERTLADFQGQVVVLDFWGLWCGACRSAVPKLKELQSKFENRPVAFVSIHSAEADADALAKKIDQFAKEHDWKYLAAIDSGKMLENSATTSEYGIKGFPSMVIIGPDGKVIYVDDDGDGPTCDEEDPVILAAFEEKFEAFWKERFAAVGEEWIPLDGEEAQKSYERVQKLYLVQKLERVLEQAGAER